MDHQDLPENTKYIIRTESLLPTSLLSRLHNNFPQHSLLKINNTPFFSKGKNKFTRLLGFRKICEKLMQHGIELSNIKERELFVEVYVFLTIRHILNTIDWVNYQKDPLLVCDLLSIYCFYNHLIEKDTCFGK